MGSLNASKISLITNLLMPERESLLDLLADLDDGAWDQTTECPEYTVKGIATHLLGDDLSLLSRQRDGAIPGLVLTAAMLPGSDFRSLLNSFNDNWVEAAAFISPPLLIELLRMSGSLTSEYYDNADPEAPGEAVQLFGNSPDGTSPIWQAIAREYLERWTHHSQIRRALAMPSLAEAPFLDAGIQIVASAADLPVTSPTMTRDRWAIGELEFGSTQQAADLLTLGHSEEEAKQLLTGPANLVALFAGRLGRGSTS